MSNIKFIIYQSFHDNPEVLITTPKLEKQLIEDWFFVGSGRDIEDYDRTEHNETGILIRNEGLRVM
jgi:hypothetical protein